MYLMWWKILYVSKFWGMISGFNMIQPIWLRSYGHWNFLGNQTHGGRILYARQAIFQTNRRPNSSYTGHYIYIYISYYTVYTDNSEYRKIIRRWYITSCYLHEIDSQYDDVVYKSTAMYHNVMRISTRIWQRTTESSAADIVSWQVTTWSTQRRGAGEAGAVRLYVSRIRGDDDSDIQKWS